MTADSIHPLGRSELRTITLRYTTRRHRGYVRGKFAGDPVYAAVADLLATAPPLPLLDIGCGMGLLGQYLHAGGMLHGYVGIDHDERLIAAGLQAARPLADALQLHCTDAAALPDVRGHVALLDMLHYLPAARQSALLRQAAGHLAPNGLLIIRNVLREPNWRFHLTRAEELFLHLSGQMRVGAQHYPRAEEIRAPLESAGLGVTIQPLYGRTPFNSFLIVARHAN